jgi:hypothetical protein
VLLVHLLVAFIFGNLPLGPSSSRLPLIIEGSRSFVFIRTPKPLLLEVKTLWSVSGQFQGESTLSGKPRNIELPFRIVDYELEAQIPTPLHNLTDHTLPITALRLGFGPLSSARIFSASLDGTVKVWCVDAHTTSDASGLAHILMTTFTFPIPVVEIVVDPLERFFFAAMSGEKGDVNVVNMYTEKEERTVSKSLANGILGEVHNVMDIPNKNISVG